MLHLATLSANTTLSTELISTILLTGFAADTKDQRFYLIFFIILLTPLPSFPPPPHTHTLSLYLSPFPPFNKQTKSHIFFFLYLFPHIRGRAAIQYCKSKQSDSYRLLLRYSRDKKSVPPLVAPSPQGQSLPNFISYGGEGGGSGQGGVSIDSLLTEVDMNSPISNASNVSMSSANRIGEIENPSDGRDERGRGARSTCLQGCSTADPRAVAGILIATDIACHSMRRLGY